MKKLKTFDSRYFIGKSHFEDNGTQNYLVFQPMYRYFRRVIGISTGNYIYLLEIYRAVWSPTTSDCRLNPQLSYLGTKARLEFRGSCLKQDKTTFNHGKIVNIYIVYELHMIYVKTSATLLTVYLEQLA